MPEKLKDKESLYDSIPNKSWQWAHLSLTERKQRILEIEERERVKRLKQGQDPIPKISKNLENILCKAVVIGGPLVLSGVGLNYTIKYALEGDYKKTVIAAICTLLNVYAAGVQTERMRRE